MAEKESTSSPKVNVKKRGNVDSDDDESEDGGFLFARTSSNDPYKQTAPDLITLLASQKPKLSPVEEEVLQNIALDTDRTTSFDHIPGGEKIKRENLTEEEFRAIERLPTWLKSMVEIPEKWALIKKVYGDASEKFINACANKIDREYIRADTNLDFELNNWKHRTDEVVAEEIEKFTIDGELRLLAENKVQNSGKKLKPDILRDIAFRITAAATHWKNQEVKELTSKWNEYYVKNASKALQNALSMSPGDEDGGLSTEDEEDGHEYDIRDIDYNTKKPKKKKEKKSKERRYRRRRGSSTKKKTKKSWKKRKLSKVPPRHGGGTTGGDGDRGGGKLGFSFGGGKLKQTNRIRRKKAIFEKYIKHRNKHFSTDHFKDFAKLFRNIYGDPVHSPYRSEDYRYDERFHTFICTLLSWNAFKFFILFITLANAIVLALETYFSSKTFLDAFDILDSGFLAIYTIEFILKIYAYPREYWKSGFNCFDFVILCISFIVKVLESFNIWGLSVLRGLRIVRTLRILRSVSLSNNLQVLVNALVNTVRTSVLSVILLLIFLMYIMALVGFYLFADSESEELRETWGFVSYSMLRMIAFVTCDGWTALLDMFTDDSQEFIGRLFCLLCLAFGHFMFSNIFVAVIIWNISEATDNYKKREAVKRAEMVRIKKESVFKRQKLDLKLLLLSQYHSQPGTKDFFQMAFRFQDMLRHDDLITLRDTITSPLWIDTVYQTYNKLHETSTILLNLHRESADVLLELKRLYDENKSGVRPIRRARYNRYMKLKAKLALIKSEIVRTRAADVKAKMEKKVHFRFD